MNNPIAPNAAVNSKPSTHLLDTIRAIRASVGDGLNDDELTCLLRENTLPTKAGFALLSSSDGYVTLTVPPQDLEDWYPKQGWIVPEKQRIAEAIAEKYELSLYEPVDTKWSVQDSQADSATVHHHLELNDRQQTVIVAHPQYLKVRLFGRPPDHRYAWESLCLLALGPDLLRDISTLYHRRPELNREPESLQSSAKLMNS